MVDELKIAGWGPAPTDLSLGADEVHVWRGTVRVSAGELDHALSALPRSERREARRHLDPRSFVPACLMRRELLGRYLEAEPAKLRFGQAPSGRLRLTSHSAPHWDFAWAGTRAVFAISATQPLGVHLDAIPRDLDVSHLAAEVPRREARLAEFLSPQSRAQALAGYHAERQAIRRLAEQTGRGGDTPGARVERLRLGKRFVAALAAQGWEWSPSFWQYGAGRGEPDDD